MQVIETRAASARLGADTIDKAAMAAVAGVLLVALVLLAVYRLPGLMAVISLAFQLIMTLFSVLTIPGIPFNLPAFLGIMLSFIVAVDTNVILLERFRREMLEVKTLESSLQGAFQKALPAILDANIVALIAAIVLMLFGGISVRGFAYSFGVGICASMISALVITRALVRNLLRMQASVKLAPIGEGGNH